MVATRLRARQDPVCVQTTARARVKWVECKMGPTGLIWELYRARLCVEGGNHEETGIGCLLAVSGSLTARGRREHCRVGPVRQ